MWGESASWDISINVEGVMNTDNIYVELGIDLAALSNSAVLACDGGNIIIGKSGSGGDVNGNNY